MLEGLFQFMKSEASVNDWSDLVFFDKFNHLFLHSTAAYSDAMQVQVFEKEFRKGNGALPPTTENTDGNDMSVHSSSLNGLIHGAAATNIERDVNTSTAKFSDRPSPSFIFLVIDDFFDTHFF